MCSHTSPAFYITDKLPISQGKSPDHRQGNTRKHRISLKKQAPCQRLARGPNKSYIRSHVASDMDSVWLVEPDVVNVQRTGTSYDCAALAAQTDGDLIDIIQIDPLIGKRL